MPEKNDFIKIAQFDPEIMISANCCSNVIQTDKIPSPVSCLPLDELKTLKKKITIANEFLLNLALREQKEEDEAERFYEIFKKLHNQHVKIHFESKSVKKGSKTKSKKNMLYSRDISGSLDVVGKDFIVLKTEKLNMIIPYRKIVFIELENNHHDLHHDSNEMDPKLRRALVMNFGEVVTKIPQLTLRFFYVTLIYYLQTFQLNKIRIKKNVRFYEGNILSVKNEKIILKNKRRIFRINIKDIDYIMFK